MRFSLLSGAYKNSGDYLIVERSKALLRHVYPDCEIHDYVRKNKLDDVLDEINSSDALILAGGPAYRYELYPGIVPLVADLDEIKVPIYSIGLGWKGIDDSSSLLYTSYKFSSKTVHLLHRMENEANLSCRDWYSVRALRENGLKRSAMTGCPAWYHIPSVDRTDMRLGWRFPYQKICISDPGETSNLELSRKVAMLIKECYPEASLFYVFHRGIKQDDAHDAKGDFMRKELAKYLQDMGIEVVDISGSANGFSIYDDCDLHVGMRVHAHIYNLSIRNPSLLLEEDGRGAGVNDALGLARLKIFTSVDVFGGGASMLLKKTYGFMARYIPRLKRNHWVLKELKDELLNMQHDDFRRIRQAFAKQKDYFEVMCRHIATFNKN